MKMRSRFLRSEDESIEPDNGEGGTSIYGTQRIQSDATDPAKFSSPSPSMFIRSDGMLARKSVVSAILGGASIKSSFSFPSPRRNLSEDDKNSAIETYPSIRSTSPIRGTSVDPPRPARDGYEWVWFPEGYWAERAFGGPGPFRPKYRRRRRGRSSNTTESPCRTGQQSPILERQPRSESWTLMNNSRSSNSSSRKSMIHTPGKMISKGLQYMSPTYPHFVTPEGEPEGLYCKAKRTFMPGSEQKEIKDAEPPMQSPRQLGIISRTTSTLEGTTSYFDRVGRHRHLRQQHGSPGQPETPSSNSSKAPRKLLGMAPWHRHGSSDVSPWTATSSIRNLLVGKTPNATPASESQSQGSKTDQYFQVEVEGSTNDPSYLQPGIRRVNTPPHSGETPTGRARGFFFDLHMPETSPREEHPSPSGTVLSKSSTNSTTKKEGQISGRPNWWDDGGNITGRAERQRMSPASFVLDIPEHLPGSPLCPMSPLHKSGGKGVCPLHGRRQTIVEQDCSRDSED